MANEGGGDGGDSSGVEGLLSRAMLAARGGETKDLAMLYRVRISLPCDYYELSPRGHALGRDGGVLDVSLHV